MTSTHKNKGFTLIELLVVTGILILITGLMLVNNTRFGGAILLENLAYDVALAVREAQVYGISVRQFSESNFDVGYGMHFLAASPQAYNLFGDANADGLWTSGEDISPSPYSIGRGYYIYKLCVPAGVDADTCQSVTQIDIVFKRPEPDAFISANGNSGIVTPSNLQESARIVMKSPRDDVASIIVEASGQIAVE